MQINFRDPSTDLAGEVFSCRPYPPRREASRTHCWRAQAVRDALYHVDRLAGRQKYGWADDCLVTNGHQFDDQWSTNSQLDDDNQSPSG